MAKQITDPLTDNVASPPAIPQKPSDKPLTDEQPPSGKSKNQNLVSGLFSRHENDAKLASLIVQVEAAPLPDEVKQTIINLIQEHGGGG